MHAHLISLASLFMFLFCMSVCLVCCYASSFYLHLVGLCMLESLTRCMSCWFVLLFILSACVLFVRVCSCFYSSICVLLAGVSLCPFFCMRLVRLSDLMSLPLYVSLPMYVSCWFVYGLMSLLLYVSCWFVCPYVSSSVCV